MIVREAVLRRATLALDDMRVSSEYNAVICCCYSTVGCALCIVVLSRIGNAVDGLNGEVAHSLHQLQYGPTTCPKVQLLTSCAPTS